MINRARAKERPAAPGFDDCFFNVDETFFPSGFYRGEVWAGLGTVNAARHLLFATDVQLRELGNCKTWWVDGTFKIIALPFRQLWTINGFLKNSEGITLHEDIKISL